jgi:tousled-like kinase
MIFREEASLAEERRLLETEKAVHIKELKRCQCEERSTFYRHLPLYNNRYLLQSMLGRGGFSEVWKAIDLIDLKEVAVKFHQLNPQWSDERKESFIRHVTREYKIHHAMKHPRVVQLYDVLDIDVNSFATVMEYCKGIDLDEKLKRSRVLSEKDARAILMQILSGLRYLSNPYAYLTAENNNNNGDNSSSSGEGGGGGVGGGRLTGDNLMIDPRKLASLNKIAIIHYDLKPANILFDEYGDAKITDFGLAKIMEDTEEGTSIELTSQGAGTYYYLPPECFVKDGASTPK